MVQIKDHLKRHFTGPCPPLAVKLDRQNKESNYHSYSFFVIMQEIGQEEKGVLESWGSSVPCEISPCKGQVAGGVAPLAAMPPEGFLWPRAEALEVGTDS